MVQDKKAHEPFQLRDQRRTSETMPASLSVSSDVRAQLQSHGLGGVQNRHYDRQDYAPKKKRTLKLWGRQSAGFENVTTRKLRLLNVAKTLDFLRSPPGNRLQTLKGDRKGRHSIRINDQFRVCFTWTDAGPRNVETVDDH